MTIRLLRSNITTNYSTNGNEPATTPDKFLAFNSTPRKPIFFKYFFLETSVFGQLPRKIYQNEALILLFDNLNNVFIH